MSWVAAAIAGGSILGAGASLIGANRQAQASRDATGLQRDIYNTSRSDLSPYREAGLAALTRLQRLMGIGPEGMGDGTGETGSLSRNFSAADLNADPVYQSGLQFGLNEGAKGINARALATGNYDSGATLKALTRYGNDYGSTKGAESYNRFVTNQGNNYSRLSGIAGSGQNAANMTGNLGAAYGGQAGSNMIGAANAGAAGLIGATNSINSGVSNYLNYDTSNRLLQGLSPGGQRNTGVVPYNPEPYAS